MRILDRITFRVMPTMGCGSWYCRLCNHKSLWLAGPDPNASTYRYQSSTSTSTDTTEWVGNYIKRDSLVMRSERSSRFSAKFRQSVIQRALSGSATISQLKEELNITDGDLMSWIGEFVGYQAERIDHLEKMVDGLLDQIPEAPRLNSSREILSGDDAERV
ncbi:MAG: hypothetical protein R3C03_13705 [Pirellulaceae bacterium]